VEARGFAATALQPMPGNSTIVQSNGERLYLFPGGLCHAMIFAVTVRLRGYGLNLNLGLLRISQDSNSSLKAFLQCCGLHLPMLCIFSCLPLKKNPSLKAIPLFMNCTMEELNENNDTRDSVYKQFINQRERFLRCQEHMRIFRRGKMQKIRLESVSHQICVDQYRSLNSIGI
jgi:hypothetical protein